MKMQTILGKLEKMKETADISGIDFLAVQVNLTDVEPGVFYVEVKDGQLNVAPYDYYDRSCAVTVTSTNFNKMIEGKLDPVLAYTTGKLKVEGDLGKAMEFAGLLKK